MPELEPIGPDKAMEMYLSQRKDEVADTTLQSHRYRLKPFVKWCEENSIQNLNDVTGRTLHEYRLHRKEDGELNTVSLRTQLSTLRVFIKFCESLDAVESGVHEDILIPTLEGNDGVRDRMLDAETAETILAHLRKYEYASKKHALFAVLWTTGCRLGAAHSLDVPDVDFEGLALTLKHRPESGTRLKNRKGGERMCALPTDVIELLKGYIEINREDATDENGREPLFTSRSGRMNKSNLRNIIYGVTRPCKHGIECPHDRDPDTCEAGDYKQASKCPSSASPHDIRRGSITKMLRNEVPKQVVSDRTNVAPDTLDTHYNQMTMEEKMEQRREHLD